MAMARGNVFATALGPAHDGGWLRQRCERGPRNLVWAPFKSTRSVAGSAAQD